MADATPTTPFHWIDHGWSIERATIAQPGKYAAVAIFGANVNGYMLEWDGKEWSGPPMPILFAYGPLDKGMDVLQFLQQHDPRKSW